MKADKVIILTLMTLVASAVGNSFSCFDGVQCVIGSSFEYDQTSCTAEWGAFPRVNKETNDLIMQQLKVSFEYLLISSHFTEWKVNRPGFANFFSKLSDDNWNEAMSLLTHMVERGGTLVPDFKVDMSGPASENGATQYQLKEIEALSKALDKERRLATRTLHLAHLANHGAGVPHDAEFADFLAERLHKNSVLRIKHLANNVKLLSDIVSDSNVDSAYALFKFDSEYLK